jgi:hypothetical protein
MDKTKLKDIEYTLMGWEHEIAKSLADQGENYEDILRALLAEIREIIN